MKVVLFMAAIRRKMFWTLERWNESKAKKAFLLVGARQTGKTYIVREFAREHFAHLAEVNFLEDEKAIRVLSEAQDAEDFVSRLSDLRHACNSWRDACLSR